MSNEKDEQRAGIALEQSYFVKGEHSWSRPPEWKGRQMAPGTRVRVRANAKQTDQDTGELVPHICAGMEATVRIDWGSITQAGYDVMIRLDCSMPEFARLINLSESELAANDYEGPDLEVNLAEHLELI